MTLFSWRAGYEKSPRAAGGTRRTGRSGGTLTIGRPSTWSPSSRRCRHLDKWCRLDAECLRQRGKEKKGKTGQLMTWASLEATFLSLFPFLYEARPRCFVRDRPRQERGTRRRLPRCRSGYFRAVSSLSSWWWGPK